MLQGFVLTVIEANKTEGGVTLRAGDRSCRYERVTEPHHTCGEARPL